MTEEDDIRITHDVASGGVVSGPIPSLGIAARMEYGEPSWPYIVTMAGCPGVGWRTKKPPCAWWRFWQWLVLGMRYGPAQDKRCDKGGQGANTQSDKGGQSIWKPTSSQ